MVPVLVLDNSTRPGCYRQVAWDVGKYLAGVEQPCIARQRALQNRRADFINVSAGHRQLNYSSCCRSRTCRPQRAPVPTALRPPACKQLTWKPSARKLPSRRQLKDTVRKQLFGRCRCSTGRGAAASAALEDNDKLADELEPRSARHHAALSGEARDRRHAGEISQEGAAASAGVTPGAALEGTAVAVPAIMNRHGLPRTAARSSSPGTRSTSSESFRRREGCLPALAWYNSPAACRRAGAGGSESTASARRGRCQQSVIWIFPPR